MKIIGYDAEWHAPSNEGRILIYLANGVKHPLMVNTPEEFTALMMLLKEPAVRFNTANGAIGVFQNPVGTTTFITDRPDGQ
ncbi:MAG: hypothetical protein QM758_05325 [Armatimonas sp.]